MIYKENKNEDEFSPCPTQTLQLKDKLNSYPSQPTNGYNAAQYPGTGYNATGYSANQCPSYPGN